MADYNPNRPRIMGQEWVGVRDESLVLDKDAEYGFRIRVNDAVTSLPLAEFDVNSRPPTGVERQVPFVSIYPAGREARTGPVQRVVIPCDSGFVSGGAQIVGSAVTVSSALESPSDFNGVSMNELDEGVRLFFDTASFSAQLSGKRILRVGLLYTFTGSFVDSRDKLVLDLSRNESLGTNVWSWNGPFDGPPTATLVTEVQTLSLGSVNPFWLTNGPQTLGTNPTSEKMPWIPADVQRFELSTTPADRLSLFVHHLCCGGTVPFIMYHAALEVLFCEENRTLCGGRVYGHTGTYAESSYQTTNNVALRTASTLVTGGLTPGDYVVTIGMADGGPVENEGSPPGVYALRELDPLEDVGPVTGGTQGGAMHGGVLVRRSTRPGSSPTSEYSPNVPAVLFKDNSIGVNRQSHAYSSLYRPASVHDGHTIEQGVLNRSGASRVDYPQVRFYARRFGRTSVALTLQSKLDDPDNQAYITPSEFDVLPELVDGWREVTLRFGSPTPSFSDAGTTTTYEFRADGLGSADRWEVLALYSTSDSSVGLGTYGDSSPRLTDGGTSVQRADAVLLFAQDPVPVTGVAVAESTQPVTGYGTLCGLPSDCVVTGIGFHRVSWSAVGGVECDSFTRTVSSGLGTADTGQAWTTAGGSASDYAVDGSRAVVLLPTGDTNSRHGTLPNVYGDVDIRATLRVDQLAVGGALNGQVMFRRQDTDNYYRVDVELDPDGTTDVAITRLVASVSATLDSVNNVTSYRADTDVHVHVQCVGVGLRARVWTGTVDDEPDEWTVETTDSAFTSGHVGFRFAQSSGNTNVNPHVALDDLVVTPWTLLGGHLEVQRFDTVDGEWRTVVSSADVCPVSFDDYESLVGVESRYRVRVCDAQNFCGAWSAEVTHTLTAPGVVGTATDVGTLIFTTNEAPEHNLAYTSAWESAPLESFAFVEAGWVELRRLFDRDLQVAFRPLERGGVQFDRTLLVNAVGVPTATLGETFRSLRDLAWGDVPYVCVRDELGNRWYAAVVVPSGSVGRVTTGHICLARVVIIETTSTPSPVSLR